MIYVTARIPEEAITYLAEDFDVRVHDLPGRETLLREIENAEGLISMLSDNIDKEVLDRGTGLKIVANYAVGYNNIDWRYAKIKGIVVTNTPGVLTDATADLTWALILAVTRKIVPADRYVRAGKFSGWHPLLFLGKGLQNKKLGILGMGRIGEAVARRGTAFGMEIIYHSRTEKSFDGSFSPRYVSFDELLKESDILSLHVPLTEETREIIGKSELEKLKKGCCIINTARGPVVAEDMLIEVLKSGRIGGAGFDVYYHEPDFDPSLADLDNVVLLPHLGSATEETRSRMAMMAADNVKRVLTGRKPLDPVY